MVGVVMTILTSVVADVAAYYLCKWLDRLFFKDSKH